MSSYSFERTGRNIWPELLTRLFVIILFLITDDAVPFKRIIQPEEAWLYKFPHMDDTISSNKLHILTPVIAAVVIFIIYKINRNNKEAVTAFLGVILSFYLATFITNVLKLAIGRPRPDFFARCFTNPPTDDHILVKCQCDKPEDEIIEGYKSFPSGHSTMAFGGMAYLSFYMTWSLKVFSQPHSQNTGLRLCAVLIPILCATLVAASRTADYHHHWQDVLVGSCIGLIVAYLCFRHNFPGLTEKRTDFVHPLSPMPLFEAPVIGFTERKIDMMYTLPPSPNFKEPLTDAENY